ncbi:hypothetical protein [Endozoicomonas sp. 8E]|uniref:hypothetical protein n=1 Tax=Endozoicomonas sp. 8E TaxID=3035692 RepID=UPI002938FC29|nr:hypothetical protein [Endozoicomonas sp. 8E]WOG27033.1 hypothetical protein P6910_21150 [Endozoicomonas sp. 8E]
MLLPLLSFVCQAKAWTGRFAVEFEQNTGVKKQKFSIKRDQLTLSALPGNPSDVTDTCGYGGPDARPDKKQHKSSGYRVKTTIIESISWQWLYTTNLLVAYELILTTKTSPLSSGTYFSVPVEVVVAVGWLLKSYWNLDSPLFNPMQQLSLSKQQEATLLLKQQDHPFASIITIYGSGYTPTQYPPPESSGQQPPQTTHLPIGSHTNPLYSGTGDGNGSPEQILHTLGLNCFVYPCHGVCQFRPSPESSGADEWPLNDDAPMSGHLPISSDDWAMVKGLLNLRGHSLPGETGIFCTPIPSIGTSVAQPTRQSFQSGQSPPHLSQTSKLQAPEALEKVLLTTSNNKTSQTDTLELAATSPSGYFPFKGDTHCRRALSNHKRKKNTVQQTCNLTIIGKNGQQQPCRSNCKNAKALSSHKSKSHSGQKVCDVPLVGEDGKQRTCGIVCKNARALTNHKSKVHTGGKTCNVTVTMEDGQQRPCGTACKNALYLLKHKRNAHTGLQTCSMTIVGKNGQQQPCAKICKSAQALSVHKSKYHSGKKTCDVTEPGEDGQQQTCGKICKNAQALSDHKSRIHGGQKVCDMTVFLGNGQKRPCGKVCKNKLRLLEHKRSAHAKQQTCNAIIVGKDGQQQPCGTVCKNARCISEHRRSAHTGLQTCSVTVVGNDGQQRPCGSVYKSTKALSDHKSRVHSGRKTCNVIIIGEDGHQQPCGRVYKNLGTLQDHKRRMHSGRKTCNQKVVGEDGQQRLCGGVCQNVQTLSKHKRIHRKRKPFDAGLDNDLNP